PCVERHPPSPQTPPLSLHHALPIYDALAADYLGRVAAWVALERESGATHDASLAGARALALWMPYQDVIRVADLKSRPERFARIDRKSTRLNSSHVKISYAVFCLKK